MHTLSIRLGLVVFEWRAGNLKLMTANLSVNFENRLYALKNNMFDFCDIFSKTPCLFNEY